jgi:hypothetical protein
MSLRTFALVAAVAGSVLLAPTAQADNKAIATDEMEAYWEFVDYGGGVIFAEQIPKDELIYGNTGSLSAHGAFCSHTNPCLDPIT